MGYNLNLKEESSIPRFDPMDHSQEKTFIRRCLKALIWESALAGDRFPLDGQIDWDFLIRTGESQRVIAFIGALLEKAGHLDRLAPSVRGCLESAMSLASWENRVKMLEFEKVQALFEEHNVAVIPLKGVALTPLVYAQFPFRRMGDIDLLIHEEDLAKTKIFLAELGLRFKQMRNRWQAEILARAWGRYSFIDGELDLDLQWSPRFWISGCWAALDMKRVWHRAQPFPGMGKSVFVFSPEDQAVHLSLQILNDSDTNIPRLVQILDLALVMKKYHVVSGAILEESAPCLDATGRGRLARLLEAVKDGFLSPDDRLLKESGEFLEPFFCPIVSAALPPISIPKILNSRRERILFKIGYLFPSESYLAKRHHPGFSGLLACYLEHWTRLIAKAWSGCQRTLEKRRPGA